MGLKTKVFARQLWRANSTRKNAPKSERCRFYFHHSVQLVAFSSSLEVFLAILAILL